MRPPPLLQLFRGFLPLPLEFSPFAFLRSTRPFSSLPLFPPFPYPATYINVHDSSVVLCPLFLLLHFFLFLLLLLSDSYSAFPDFFISSSRHSPPFVTSATSSCFFLCLVFMRFPLDYSIDPRNSLVLSRVFSLFNLLIYECFANFFLKIFIFYIT